MTSVISDARFMMLRQGLDITIIINYTPRRRGVTYSKGLFRYRGRAATAQGGRRRSRLLRNPSDPVVRRSCPDGYSCLSVQSSQSKSWPLWCACPCGSGVERRAPLSLGRVIHGPVSCPEAVDQLPGGSVFCWQILFGLESS